MKARILLTVLLVSLVLAFSACSNNQSGDDSDNTNLSSITEVYDQYSGFSTDFISTNDLESPGLIDFSTEKRYFPIDAVDLKLYFGF